MYRPSLPDFSFEIQMGPSAADNDIPGEFRGELKVEVDRTASSSSAIPALSLSSPAPPPRRDNVEANRVFREPSIFWLLFETAPSCGGVKSSERGNGDCGADIVGHATGGGVDLACTCTYPGCGIWRSSGRCCDSPITLLMAPRSKLAGMGISGVESIDSRSGPVAVASAAASHLGASVTSIRGGKPSSDGLDGGEVLVNDPIVAAEGGRDTCKALGGGCFLFLENHPLFWGPTLHLV
ncbi:hypothetical protein F5J12DRAFT_781649 [Pisolithus orientalis]|uniref:uncharacterized protein n=1 Tax=Pisolithus orientalis TaxID=936130 RepID=UPI002224313E|nr:uncharacterized protein F5J12DRAFT_781649 [Pisolithus orientalis]KAI6012784.1 hypothetical protein F5J12DRAFT_781649 [Pisolithus orientalis]